MADLKMQNVSLDPLSTAERSERMRRVAAKDTKPEMVVRRLVHAMGYRYCLHRRDMPGHPDLVFPRRKKLIFVNGCFWHLHDCGTYKLPKSRTDYWLPKLEANRQRDEVNLVALQESGWDTLVVWECQLRDRTALSSIIRLFLDEPHVDSSLPDHESVSRSSGTH